MAKNKKPLLNEGTVRRMMKLANMESLGDNFITEKWGSKKHEFHRHMDDEGHETKSGDVGGGKYGKGGHYKDYEQPYGGDKGDESKTRPGRKDYVKEEDELEAELGATEDELGAEDEVADEEAAELDSEVTITDDEAQDIIDLADKLRDAVGDEDGESEEEPLDLDIDAEEEIDIEDPGVRNVYEEELYEAALKGLNIEVVEDKATQQKELVAEVKKRIYERVIRRLIAEGKQK